jgi:hypothetical protein
MENTFSREIEFEMPVFNSETGIHERLNVKKVAYFRELSRMDKTQHKLHFKLISVFESNEDERVQVDSDKLYDITVQAIKLLLITDKNFTEQDKTIFLSDSGALFKFGYWFLAEKIAPFFSILTNS